MRNRLFYLATLLIFALVFAGCVAPAPAATDSSDAETESAASDEPTELIVSTWGFNQDLIDENLTTPFEEMYNVEIVYETGNNSERLAKLSAWPSWAHAATAPMSTSSISPAPSPLTLPNKGCYSPSIPASSPITASSTTGRKILWATARASPTPSPVTR